MTLIMNNLSLSASILAFIFSVSIMYLQYKTEVIDREERMKAMEKKRIEMSEAYFNFHKYDNN